MRGLSLSVNSGSLELLFAESNYGFGFSEFLEDLCRRTAIAFTHDELQAMSTRDLEWLIRQISIRLGTA
jgi:hypothetical protein